MWAIATGISIGATSFLAGKVEKKNQSQTLKELHLSEILAWIASIETYLSSEASLLRKKIDDALEKIQQHGWSTYVQEIAMLQGA